MITSALSRNKLSFQCLYCTAAAETRVAVFVVTAQLLLQPPLDVTNTSLPPQSYVPVKSKDKIEEKKQ